MTERLNLLSYRRNLRRRSTSKSDYTRWLGPSWAPISDRAAAESAEGGGRPPGGSQALRQYRQQFRGGRDPGATGRSPTRVNRLSRKGGVMRKLRGHRQTAR